MIKTSAYGVFKGYVNGLDYYYLCTKTDFAYCEDENAAAEVFIFYAGLWETFYFKTQTRIDDLIIKEIKK